MKFKVMSALTGAVLLAATAIPLNVNAVQAVPGQHLLAQATTPQGQGKLADLNLTQNQKARMRQLHQETRQKIEAVLTQEQKQQYTAALQNRSRAVRDGNGDMNFSSVQRSGRHNVMASLNLTQNQKNKIRDIMQSARSRMNGILTEAQRSQLQEMLRSQQSRAQ